MLKGLRPEKVKKGDVIVYSTTTCPHCKWISEAFDQFAKENLENISAYHWEFDILDNSITPEKENEVPLSHQQIYLQQNPKGYVPFFSFGCKYTRLGNGFESQSNGIEKEKQEFDLILKELLNSS